MLNDRRTQGAEAQTSAHPFPTKWVILGAVFSGVLLPIGQQYLGDGWTIFGAVVGTTLGSLSVVIDWKVGGYAKRGFLHAGWSKPLSKRWAVVEGVLVVISFGLVCELMWRRVLVGLGLGIFVAPLHFVFRVVSEQYRHAAPKPTPWAFLVLGGVGLIIGLIVGGICGDLAGMWLDGFTGTMLGGFLGAIVSHPKWAFWGGVIGLVFSGLLVSVLFVIQWFLGDGVHGLSWGDHAFAVVFFTFIFAALAALLKMLLPGPTSNNKAERPTTTENGENHGC